MPPLLAPDIHSTRSDLSSNKSLIYQDAICVLLATQQPGNHHTLPLQYPTKPHCSSTAENHKFPQHAASSLSHHSQQQENKQGTHSALLRTISAHNRAVSKCKTIVKIRFMQCCGAATSAGCSSIELLGKRSVSKACANYLLIY